MIKEINVDGVIRLDSFLKWAGIADTGGTAKILIQNGKVVVNGKVETRRGKKLSDGDLVQLEDNFTYKVKFTEN